MKQMFTKLGIMFLVCLACVSCKDDTTYPEALEGVWSSSASTGYTCDVTFNMSASVGQFCTITVAGPDEESAGVYDGRYNYDQASGLATVTFDAIPGGPTKATLQSDGGDKLTVSFTGIAGTYTVSKATFPKSIAGMWLYEAPGMTVIADLYPYAVNGGLAGVVTVTGFDKPFGLTYTYDSATGKAEFSVTGMSDWNGTLEYSQADGSLSIKQDKLFKDALKMERKAPK